MSTAVAVNEIIFLLLLENDLTVLQRTHDTHVHNIMYNKHYNTHITFYECRIASCSLGIMSKRMKGTTRPKFDSIYITMLDGSMCGFVVLCMMMQRHPGV